MQAPFLYFACHSKNLSQSGYLLSEPINYSEKKTELEPGDTPK